MQDTEYRIQDKNIRNWESGIGNRNNKGFTMIELVITMVLIGIVAYIAADAMSTGFKAFFVTDNRKEALDQARIAMERMTREIRNVQSLSDIGTANGTAFCFFDIDGTRVSFRYSANAITREEPTACPGIGGSTLADNITSFSFTYLQENNSIDPTPPNSTKRIRINITTTISGENVSLQSEVWPRNF